ncbi:MAG: leucine-rich repeat domain-containing protein, partial [Paludibacteraceae bacterium]|nr:leucine-rich repeat domain-containing protein [Paludibacteraceae bacterium]
MKQTFCLARATLLLLMMMFTSISAWADDSGTCGANLTWVFTESDGTLTISGEGDMYNFATTDAPWQEYKEKIKNVILPEGLTTIDQYAFSGAVNLEKITIPASVETIAENAFQNVGSKLSNGCILTVAQGSKLSSIGSYAFKAFKGTIDLHECTSLATIAQYTFSDAFYLKEISIPTSVVRFESYAFKNVGSKLSKGCTLTIAQGSQLKFPKANA